MWSVNINGNLVYTRENPSYWDNAPQRKGYRLFFVARTPGRVRWTYKKN
jgi:ribosomal protein L24E